LKKKKETQKRRRHENEERERYDRRGSKSVDEREETGKGESRKEKVQWHGNRNYGIFRSL
jgi:hypothetical protein